MIVTCPSCGHQNSFEQPYPYHAGFSNQGFLYNDAGDRTLVWSSYDSAWENLVGRVHPWALDEKEWSRVEAALVPLNDGSRWRASNRPRCTACNEPIGKSIGDAEIHYLVYPGSLLLDDAGANGFSKVLGPGASAA
jgi:hypothetical protein